VGQIADLAFINAFFNQAEFLCALRGNRAVVASIAPNAMCNLRLNLVFIVAIAVSESWFLPVHRLKDTNKILT